MQKLKRGYTTGSCAAAATKAAAIASLTAKNPRQVKIKLPNGESLIIPVQDFEKGDNWASCAVQKYSGDDPDVTAGSLIYSKVEFLPLDAGLPDKALEIEGDDRIKIQLLAGEGVGIVTKPGLACGVGEPAINPVPRKMIAGEAYKIAREKNFKGLIRITISVAGGQELAEKTFNPRLGILGGISILGSTGRVEPMSEQALIETILAEISVKRAEGRKVAILTPGNYGLAFLDAEYKIPDRSTIKISNFLGEALDMVGEKDFEAVLFSAHLGKLIKVAGGVMNTHSKYGDYRMEILASYAHKCGLEERLLRQIHDCTMVDEALRILDEAGKKDQVMQAVVEGADRAIKKRLEGKGAKPLTAVMTFSNKYGLLAKSKNFPLLMEKIKEDIKI